MKLGNFSIFKLFILFRSLALAPYLSFGSWFHLSLLTKQTPSVSCQPSPQICLHLTFIHPFFSQVTEQKSIFLEYFCHLLNSPRLYSSSLQNLLPFLASNVWINKLSECSLVYHEIAVCFLPLNSNCRAAMSLSSLAFCLVSYCLLLHRILSSPSF